MKQPNEQYDIVFTSGRVIDPETYRDGIYNVGIKGDQIAAISDQPPYGQKTQPNRETLVF